MKPPLTVTLDREKLNHPVHVKEEKSNKERRDKEMRKLRKNEGFTLAELLIVVAIIAVLVAVSIPIFTRQLEKSREATDRANQRAAKAAAVTALLDDSSLNSSTLYYYDAVQGILVSSPPKAYGKGTTLEATTADDEYAPKGKYEGGYISVQFTNGTATLAWAGDCDNNAKNAKITIDPTKDVFYPKAAASSGSGS